MSGESSLIDSWSGGPVATKHDGQQNMKPLRADAERLTVEAAFDHLELFEIRESAPFGRDSTSELVVIDVWVFAKVEHLE